MGRKFIRITISIFLFLVLTVLYLGYYQHQIKKSEVLLINVPSSRTLETRNEINCHFPLLDPFDPSVQEFIRPPDPVDCEKKMPRLFRTNFDSTLIPMKVFPDQSCCYRTMERKPGSDTGVRLSKKCYHLEPGEPTEIPHEFISVNCNFTETKTVKYQNFTRVTSIRRNVTDMFAFVPTKRSVEERMRKFNKFGPNPITKDALSVLILGMDAQSRMNFLRQMPLTYNFLIQNLSAIEFTGYTKVGDNTFPNVVPILTGLNVTELRKLCWTDKRTYFDSCPFIWNLFRQHGYATSYGEDSVWMGIFSYEKRGFWKPPTDYYLNPFISQMAKRIGHEPLGNVKLCYGPRLSFEVLLDWIVKTAVRFQESPYFQFIWANSLFHDYLNYPKLGDEMLSATLKFLQAQNFLNHTLLVLLSDHGLRWGGIRNTVQGRLEERMPMNFWIFPPWFEVKYNREMALFRKNANKLTTPFDVHATLKSLLTLDLTNQESGRGISFFDPIPPNRTCAEAGIEEHWCVCNGLSNNILDKNLTIVQTGATFIVSQLNSFLSNHSQCAKLKLHEIIHVTGQSSGKSSGIVAQVQFNHTILQIVLTTVPGDAIFEATISFGGISIGPDHFVLVGEVSRTNLYASQSSCLTDFILRKYCFCILPA